MFFLPQAQAFSGIPDDTGDFIITNASDDADVTFSNNVLTINTGSMTISTNGQETSQTIQVAREANLTLNNVNIHAPSMGGAINLFVEGGGYIQEEVTINLAAGSHNYLIGESGIQKMGGFGSSRVGNLTIDGSGSLVAQGTLGSGIGGCNFGVSAVNMTIKNGHITAIGGPAAAGIGGSSGSSSIDPGGYASKVSIEGGIVYAYGGYSDSYGYGAGIGGGGFISGSCSNNSISGNAIVYAASGDAKKDALEGFADEDLKQGIVFQGVVTDSTTDPYTVQYSRGDIYGPLTLASSLTNELTLPVTTTIDKNATFKVANDSKLTIPNTMSLQNDGKLDSLKNITIANGGSITTANNFYLKDQTSPSTSNYATYLTSTGVVQNYTNVPALPQNYIHGWFSNKDGTGTQIYNGKPVELNLHNFYEVESEAYLINAPSVEHGTITLNKDYAFQGEKVSFTLSPDEGYRVGEVTVTTEDGKTIQLEEAGNTYSFTMPASEVTIHVIFSEGAGEDSLITIESPEHGTITADKDKAKEGDSVSFTVSPDEGYELKEGSLTITDSEGNIIDYTVKDGIYSFIMPATGVFISAVFEPIPTDTISITFTTAEGSWQGLHELTIEGEPDQIVVAPDYPEAPADKTCIGWFDEADMQVISGVTKFSDITGTVTARYAYTPGWHQNSSGWWYVYDLNNNYYTNCWALIHGFWFYFNDAGYCLEYTWGYINGVWYYFTAGGYMQTGWQYLNHTWYFLDRYTGEMKTGWQKDGVWYYLNPETGAMYDNCWAYINGNWYGFNEGGSMTQGWSWSYAYDGWFYLQPETGHMLYGWQYIGGHWYYFYDNGLMAANTYVGTYRLSADGAWS